MPEKAKGYANLVACRKQCRRCQALKNPAEVKGGRFDSDHLGPWSAWYGNLNARVMVVGQDWGSVEHFVANEGKAVPTSATNTMLGELLQPVGLDLSEVFLTNAILCLKTGGKAARVKKKWADTCGGAFLRPLVEIVCPQVVVCLGGVAWRAMASAFHVAPRRLKDAVKSDGVSITGDTTAIAVYHPSPSVLNRTRNRKQQFRDWRRVGNRLATT